jgi:hypothetical protein
VFWLWFGFEHQPIGVSNVFFEFLQSFTLTKDSWDFPQFTHEPPFIYPVLQSKKPFHDLTPNFSLADTPNSLNLDHSEGIRSTARAVGASSVVEWLAIGFCLILEHEGFCIPQHSWILGQLTIFNVNGLISKSCPD